MQHGGEVLLGAIGKVHTPSSSGKETVGAVVARAICVDVVAALRWFLTPLGGFDPFGMVVDPPGLKIEN